MAVKDNPPVPKVAIRIANERESDAIADVWLRSRTASIPSIPAPIHSPEAIRRWFREVVLPTMEVWVAEVDQGLIIGLLALVGDWVDQLYTDPEWVGRGIGSRLLTVAKQRRPRGLDLGTFQSNLGARRFYERHGFRIVDSTDGDNEEGAPDIRYHWAPAGDTSPIGSL